MSKFEPKIDTEDVLTANGNNIKVHCHKYVFDYRSHCYMCDFNRFPFDALCNEINCHKDEREDKNFIYIEILDKNLLK